ncbi:MAG: o-succinylbenzoate synthase [Propionibacteriaceae bacterium]|jgi:O-succinylbenzoate synthase|nr:o-succinylbenzoate synthase [Propionibacteriaceae bacterium]
MAEAVVYSIPMAHRFRGITTRVGLVFRGDAGWAEWSPFPEYPPAEAAQWLRAAREAADQGYPAPRRVAIPVNSTIPAVDPVTAYALAARAGCRTAKVKVAEPGQTLADDEARVEAVRAALGRAGKLRIDANGGWTLDEARRALTVLGRYDLEYAEQPCRETADLARLRRAQSVPVAADESIRRAEDPFVVKRLGAADIVVLKVQPLGGVRACLRLAEALGLDVVVSSALETSVGLRAGLALAAALPELKYACGLATLSLLTADVVAEPLVARDGQIDVRDIVVDDARLAAVRADDQTTATWRARLACATREAPWTIS